MLFIPPSHDVDCMRREGYRTMRGLYDSLLRRYERIHVKEEENTFHELVSSSS